ncbi:MAG: hypothetical protein U0T84_07855 [Chitinophagales bacterium]
MKQLFTLAAWVLMVPTAFAQITINSSDMPVPSSSFSIFDITSPATTPTMGANQNWDFSTWQGTSTTSNSFPLETDTFFTNRGVDVYISGTKSFNSSFGYYIANEWDFNSAAIDDKGYYVPEQHYGLGMLTSNNSDSLIIPLQKKELSAPRRMVQFPMTMGAAWSTKSRRVTDFNLTVSAFSLNNVPAEHAYTIYRSDSIVGYGKVSIYTASGPSAPVDVLVDQVASANVDSFYVNGAPAPTAFTSGFSVTQGGISGVQHLYNFYRKGAVNYFLRFSFGNDASYTTLANAYVNPDNVVVAGVNDVAAAAVQITTFPNPLHGNTLKVMVQDAKPGTVIYELQQLTGAIVAEGQFNTGSMHTITIGDELANGVYLLHGRTASGQVFNEKIMINR